MNPKKFMERTPKRPVQGRDDLPEGIKASRKQEKRVASRMGGSRMSRSGAGRRAVSGSGRRIVNIAGGKGDVSTDVLLGECKTIVKGASISVKQAHLIKITREAHLAGKSPAEIISFPLMPDDTDNDWILIPLGAWEKIRKGAFTPRKVKIKQGWEREGAELTVIGPPVWNEQWWVPVLDPDEEEPTFHKAAGLEGYESWGNKPPYL